MGKQQRTDPEKGLQHELGWVYYTLQFLGVMPHPVREKSMYTVFMTLEYYILSNLNVIFTILPEIACLVMYKGGFEDIVSSISIMLPIFVSWVKHVTLRTYGKELTEVTEAVMMDWSREMTDEQQIKFDHTVKQNRFISKICTSISALMETTFTMFQIVAAMQEPEDVEGFALRGLFVLSWFPYNTRKSPVHELTWLAQCIGSGGASVVFTAHDCFFAILSLHISAQYAMLRMGMRNIAGKFDANDPKKFYNSLNEVIERQAELNRLAAIIESCFHLVTCLQTVVCTVMFCLTGFRMLLIITSTASEDLPIVALSFFVVHIVFTLMHIFLYCYAGDKISRESTALSLACYESVWYNLPARQAREFIIVLRRSNRPVILTAAKFHVYSLEFFAALLKTSLGYLSVMVAMKDKLSL